MQALDAADAASRPKKKQRRTTPPGPTTGSGAQPSSAQPQPIDPQPTVHTNPSGPSTSTGPPRPRPIFRQVPLPTPVKVGPPSSKLTHAKLQNGPGSLESPSQHPSSSPTRAAHVQTPNVPPAAISSRPVKVGPPSWKATSVKPKNTPGSSGSSSQHPPASQTRAAPAPASSATPSTPSLPSRPQQPPPHGKEKTPLKALPQQSTQKTPSVLLPVEKRNDAERSPVASKPRLLAPKPEKQSPPVSLSRVSSMLSASSSCLKLLKLFLKDFFFSVSVSGIIK